MDQLRTTTAQLSAHQRSTTDSSEQWFTLDNRRGPIWGQEPRILGLSAATAMILPSLMILCSRSLVLASLPSCAAEGTSRRRNHA
jgi:hypothetical protein